MALMADRIKVTRQREKFVSDDRRVITRLFVPGDKARVRSVLDRVLRLSPDEVSAVLAQVKTAFADRHKRMEDIWREHFNEVAGVLGSGSDLREDQQLLIGAFFTMEYAVESAALFNPSIVLHYDQSGLPPGAIRFLMSLRATGEGHVSSIVFRTGVIDAAGGIRFDAAGPFAHSLKPLQDGHTFKSSMSSSSSSIFLNPRPPHSVHAP